MKSKHSAGPWRIFRDGTIEIWDSVGKIATVKKMTDARLIAAAPELLEALRRITELGGNFGRQSFQFDEALDKAWDAIEKAETNYQS